MIKLNGRASTGFSQVSPPKPHSQTQTAFPFKTEHVPLGEQEKFEITRSRIPGKSVRHCGPLSPQGHAVKLNNGAAMFG